jgi:hypothetical protein
MILECKQCEALVNAEELSRYELNEDDWPITYTFLKCPKCQRPLLAEEDIFGPERVYPPSDNRINPNLPEPLRVAYGEALACFKSKAHTATAIMCRKTLEGICVEHGVKARTLVSSLKELKDRGIIESRLFEWADALRISGNEAAHDVKVTISAEDARDILEFTNALLEYVFTFRDKFEAFKKRRMNADGA